MATKIKSIPVLKTSEAKRFIEKANIAFSKRGTIDFSNEVKSTIDILKKAKMNGYLYTC